MDNLAALPGAEFIEQGIEDLEQGLESTPALLVSIGRPRLIQLGYEIPDAFEDPEKKLYLRLAAGYGDAAHKSFQRAHQTAGLLRARGSLRSLADSTAIEGFMAALGVM